MKNRRIKTLEDLQTYAREFVRHLRGGEIVGLIGPLGAGKTTFVQMLAAELGVETPPKSPTFILMQVLETGKEAKKAGISQICHVDAYRLEDFAELKRIGFEEYAGRKDTVTLVEWADRTPGLHRKMGYIELTFAFEANEIRLLSQGR